MPNQHRFCFRNSTDDLVNGLHVIFDGVHGTLAGGVIINTGPPGRVTGEGSQINVLLKAPLVPGMPLCFTVESHSQPINVQSALWSWNYNIVGHAEAMPDALEVLRPGE